MSLQTPYKEVNWNPQKITLRIVLQNRFSNLYIAKGAFMLVSKWATAHLYFCITSFAQFCKCVLKFFMCSLILSHTLQI